MTKYWFITKNTAPRIISSWAFGELERAVAFAVEIVHLKPIACVKELNGG